MTPVEVLAAHLSFVLGCTEEQAAPIAQEAIDELMTAGHTVVNVADLDRALWVRIGDECDAAPLPNYEENDYNAGFVAGLAHAQMTVRSMLGTYLLAAAAAAEPTAKEEK